MGAADVLTRQVGPLPMGVWVLLAGAGVYVAVRSSKADTAAPATVVEQVPVPVGAVAGYDNAPLVMSPVVRINLPELGELTDAVVANTGALGTNTGALGANTGALGTNTGALGANTGAVSGLTGAVGALTSKVGQITSTPAPSAPAAPAPAPQPAPAPARTYTIRSGDTLWGITARFTGNGARWRELYSANAATIDRVASSRGKAGGGNWIFPGTVLTLPW